MTAPITEGPGDPPQYRYRAKWLRAECRPQVVCGDCEVACYEHERLPHLNLVRFRCPNCQTEMPIDMATLRELPTT